MAKALFVTRTDLVSQTVIGGAVDTDKFTQNVKLVQDIYLKNIIGKDLLEKLEDDVINSTLTGDYLTLVKEYIKPYLVYMAASDYILEAWATVGNGGISQYDPDNATAVSYEDASKLSTNIGNKGEHYGKRLIDYLKDNKSLFAEYEQSTTKSYFYGWQLDTNNGCNENL